MCYYVMYVLLIQPICIVVAEDLFGAMKIHSTATILLIVAVMLSYGGAPRIFIDEINNIALTNAESVATASVCKLEYDILGRRD